MTHLSRLDKDLLQLLHGTRVAALGTLDNQGAPYVSMTPFAILQEPGCLVLHLSGLAAHTQYLQASPDVSLLVMQPEQADASALNLPRVTLSCQATVLPHGSDAATPCRNAYLARFPDAEPMTGFADFRFVMLHVTQARHVAGFGAARSLEADRCTELLRLPAKD